MGCRDGRIFVIDPLLQGKGRVNRFNCDDDSKNRKPKKVTLVKWFEPSVEGENNNKFAAVFEDGSIYVFFKDSKHTQDSSKDKVKFTTEPF